MLPGPSIQSGTLSQRQVTKPPPYFPSPSKCKGNRFWVDIWFYCHCPLSFFPQSFWLHLHTLFHAESTFLFTLRLLVKFSRDKQVMAAGLSIKHCPPAHGRLRGDVKMCRSLPPPVATYFSDRSLYQTYQIIIAVLIMIFPCMTLVSVNE